MSPGSFEKYIENKYYDEVFFKVRRCFNAVKSHMDLHTYSVPYPVSTLLDEIRVVHAYFKDQNDGDYSELKLRVEAVITIKGGKESDYEDDQVSRYFFVTCKGIFDGGLHSFSIVDVEEQIGYAYKNNESLSNCLIPYMAVDSMDERAEQFLSKYCPEALDKPMPLPVTEILKRMHVTMYQAPLKNKVFGKTFFMASKEQIYDDDNEVVEKEIPKRTILIDPDSFFLRNIGSYINTIIHECVHVEYHSKFFELQRFSNSDIKSFACKIGSIPEFVRGSFEKELSIMEWQANTLAPKILMPAQTFMMKYYEVINDVSSEYSDASSGDKMREVIDRLANFFNTSKIGVKIRLVDLGIDTAVGVNNFINETKYPNYSFKEHTLKHDQTFMIDFIDSVKEIASNPKLRKLSANGAIAYANGMVVINSPKYVTKSNSGERVLTSYALEHVDECAFIFTKKSKPKDPSSDFFNTVCFLCRTSDKKDYVPAIYDNNENKNKVLIDYIGEMEDTLGDISEALEVIKTMNGTFAESFVSLMCHLGYVKDDGTINKYAISKDTGIDDHTIDSYLNGKSIGKKDKLLRICASFNLHPRVAYHFLLKAGIDIQATSCEEDYLYCNLIEQHSAEGIDGWNKRLRAAERDDLML